MASDENEIDQLKAEITRLQQSQKAKDQFIQQVTAERDELQNTMQEMGTIFEEMTKKAAEKDAKCNRLSKELERVQKRVTIVEQELQEEEAANKALTDTIETLKRARSISLQRQPSTQDLNELMTKIQKLEQLLSASQEKVDENEKLRRDINELTQLFEELQAKIKMRDETIQDYEAKLEELQNEYREELQGNEHLKMSYTALNNNYEVLKRGKSVASVDSDTEDVNMLQDQLQVQHQLMRQLSDEKEKVVDSITRDKDNVVELLEQTYEIINEELVRRLKQHKLVSLTDDGDDSSKRKTKRIESPDTLREHLQQIRESLISQNAKLQQLDMSNHAKPKLSLLGSNDSRQSRNDDEKHHEYLYERDEDQDSDIDVERVLKEAPPNQNPNQRKSWFSFFKDF
eukprot:CAMPEP_0202704558 /NCGR_PEP_ID=MMETSP1385-20130828/17219_1 /ASSEMBLY_ACC=CAM_ASM_000861 /TAXON_ID=933848 /ORGANISM="Elphidium margaritaceum" /LENGTH=400 /DNA_ID=CAMNT_0049362611 /DNA_START=14 /DNA_END=1216 /DNA_ORIENTATION=-